MNSTFDVTFSSVTSISDVVGVACFVWGEDCKSIKGREVEALEGFLGVLEGAERGNDYREEGGGGSDEDRCVSYLVISNNTILSTPPPYLSSKFGKAGTYPPSPHLLLPLPPVPNRGL